MRIAVTFENETGDVFQHFGHTERFKIYDIEDKEIKATSVINTNGNGHGALSAILKSDNVDKLICGGIGGGAKKALAEAGIELYGGVSGNADEQIAAFIRDELKFNPNIECTHHGNHHHDHDCSNRHGKCEEQ